MVNRRNERGGLIVELAVALSILAAALIPLGLSFANDQRACRRYYERAVALEIVDGEMEALVAGEWRAYREGEQPYPVRAAAAQNLPPGRFVLTIQGRRLRLAWQPDQPRAGAPVVREVTRP